MRKLDRLMFPFSFGPFLGFWAAFEAGCSLGNLCLPAGGMTTSARLGYLFENEITVVCCTPTYALHVAETANSHGIPLAKSTVRLLIVAGEPGGNIPTVRGQIEKVWGARVIDHSGMTEIGPWGFECEENPGGLHIIESEFIAEVIDPATGATLPDGEQGELVLTNLGRLGSPLIRYRTGDIVQLRRERCACGRHFAWAEGGIIGRIDDMLIIKGNNVFPSVIEAIVREFQEISEFQLRVFNQNGLNELQVDIEPGPEAEENLKSRLADRVASRIRDVLHFRPEVTVVNAGTLPRFDMKARRVARDQPPPAH